MDGSAEGQQMSRQSRGKSWLDFRLSDHLAADSGSFSVDLVARRGTGIQGFRMTIVFVPESEGEQVEVDLPNAASTADVHRVVRELTDNTEKLDALLREGHR
jgi:hypothetical protein